MTIVSINKKKIGFIRMTMFSRKHYKKTTINMTYWHIPVDMRFSISLYFMCGLLRCVTAQTDTALCLQECTSYTGELCGGTAKNTERANACGNACKLDTNNRPVCARACGVYLIHRARDGIPVDDVLEFVCQDPVFFVNCFTVIMS